MKTFCSIWQCRKFEGNLAEASVDGPSHSCGGGGVYFLRGGGGFSRGSCLGCLNAIYGRVWYRSTLFLFKAHNIRKFCLSQVGNTEKYGRLRLIRRPLR